MKKNINPLYPALLSSIRTGLAEGELTQAQVGEKLGIKQSAVSTLLSGKAQLSATQLLDLCDLIGVRLQKLASLAESSIAETLPMTKEIESTIFKTPAHVICYTAATQEVKANQVKVKNHSPNQIRQCFNDLAEVGILKKVGRDSFIQQNPSVTLSPSNAQRTSKAHQTIAAWTASRHEEQKEQGSLPQSAVNWYELDRLTLSQATEIQSMFLQLWEKISSFQQKNQSEVYNSSEKMILWNIHMMLMPATDEPHA